MPIADKREPEESELKRYVKLPAALISRCLVACWHPARLFNVEAACQVAHALGVSAVTVEEDFFTAVDDLNRKEDDAGSAHMGEKGFASALFYSYICISRDLLLENLNGDEALVARTLKALAETALTVSPTGNQNALPRVLTHLTHWWKWDAKVPVRFQSLSLILFVEKISRHRPFNA